ncbi:hypothetical protein [Bosea sp. PAMC 26642]|uniref:hypothetical protein n=1 Tax=Bosea sp. (strain PAMC 26642) TaxID=1792307 RepID=UPI00076FF76D|nr:hypothetical protein [Bosea sp. PAMC 26642]AMJ61369.1 hypothetical protein AXW83_14660 [Bosea sp. PAMC 26642]
MGSALRWTGPALAGVLTASPLAAQEMVSSYTRHHYEACRKSPAGNDLMETTCIGPAGIRIVWTAEADSTSVNFGKRTIGESLFEGLEFFEAGTTIEWRGPKGRRPQIAILRYKAGKTIGNLDVTRLVVHRIGQDDVSCIVGSVDGRGKDANAQARRLADENGGTFRCGQDKRLDR